jgi:LacI family transcriptional regulator
LVKERVTSQDVADVAGVSRTTVSLTLNEVQTVQISQKTRQKVIKVARDLGYVPDAAAQALASRRSRIIGLLLTRSPHHLISDDFFTQIIDSLINVIHQQDMRLMIDIVEPDHQQEIYINLVRSKKIDGILLSGPRFDDDALMVLAETSFPTVLLGQLPDSDFCSVDVDNFSAAQTAVEHLISLGHTSIACITNTSLSYTASKERLNGYRSALRNSGLKFDPDLVAYADFTVDSGYECITDLISRRKGFSAVFVASDTVAIGAVSGLKKSGLKVPQDIAVVGFDDISYSRYMDPPLTTVRLPASELAHKASEMLIGLLKEGQPADKHLLLDTNLIVRSSCGASLAS